MIDVLKQIKPNFVLVLASLMFISYWLLGQVNLSEIVVYDSETARVGIEVYTAAVLSLMTLIIGGFVASLKDLLAGSPPPPEMTEETAVELIRLLKGN